MTWFCCTKTDLNHFIKEAKPLDQFVYYTGHITETLVGRAIAKELYALSTKGLVYLVQQRSKVDLGYNYVAIRASKKPTVSLIPFTAEKLAEMEARVKQVRQYVRTV